MDILINDEDKKQSLTITTPKGSVIVVDDEQENCTISDKDKKNLIQLDYKKGQISVTAEKKIVLKAGTAELAMDGNAGNITVKAKKFAVTADNEIGLKANAALKMEGAQVQVKGSAQVKVEASGPLALKGAIAQIN